MKLERLVACSQEVGATRSRKKKIAALAGLIEGTPDELLPRVVAWLSGELPEGKIGVGYAAIYGTLKETEGASSSSLSMADVQGAITAIAGSSGKGSVKRKRALLAEIFTAATEPERAFLAGLLSGELRQGALAGVMADALAAATGIAPAVVRRAAMLAGDLARVARVARAEGEAGLAAFRGEVFRPLQPMLAQTAETPEEALATLGGVGVFDYKLDGARVQVHKDGDRVQVFTRGMNNVTGAVPEVVQLARSLPAERVILDGEVLALRPDGRPHTFQTTMTRFGRKVQSRVAELRNTLPLTPFVFDVVLRDDEELLDAPLTERAAALDALIPEPHRVPRLLTSDVNEAAAFVERSLAEGHEGVMAKALESTWEAGSRGSSWLKLKPSWTLDLVVLAAEWGSGRRSGWLSNLHLGARDPDGGFVMLGKTFKGLTDATLAWQTEQLLAREERRDKHVVHVRAELVVEIAFNEIQTSPRYPSGLALRFARVKGYRVDKTAVEADTIDIVRRIHAGELTLLDALAKSQGRTRLAGGAPTTP
ncbi:MAG: ATP-dependent DNA ligase [Deltaproteobacteria bacterium]|nr:ATP-dependent DNA ligase [Deltaproteobacteria bacterium]